jgi:hypothetical protein
MKRGLIGLALLRERQSEGSGRAEFTVRSRAVFPGFAELARGHMPVAVPIQVIRVRS